MADNHGNTPAAWTAVAVGLVGFTVGSLALMTQPVNMTLFWIGVALLPIAIVAFVVMTKMGLGDR